MDDEPAFDAVFWDVGGVILDVASVERAHAAFVSALCATYPSAVAGDEAVDRWRDAVGDYFADREPMAFRPARVAYDRAVEAVVGEPVPRAEWRPIFHEAFDEHVSAVPGATEAIETLAGMDPHLGVISDVDHDEGRRILEAFGVFDRFDSYTSSEAVGHTKPHPAMFETALDAADVAPEDAVMIGDRYRHDMEGAKDVGLATIAFGAADGPAVDYRVDDLRQVVDVVAGRRTSEDTD